MEHMRLISHFRWKTTIPLLLNEASQVEGCPPVKSAPCMDELLLSRQTRGACRRGGLSAGIFVQEQETMLWIPRHNSERNFHQRMSLIKIRQDSRSNKKTF